jgi:hypothetical protein
LLFYPIFYISLRYFSDKEGKIVDDFLGVVEVKSGTGEDLYLAAVTMIEGNLKLKMANCIGFGSGD